MQRLVSCILLLLFLVSTAAPCPTCELWEGGEYVLCGFDGETYSSRCELFVTLCEEGQLETGDDVDINTINVEQQVEDYIDHAGKCEGSNPEGNCPKCQQSTDITEICSKSASGPESWEFTSYCGLAKYLCEEGLLAFDEYINFDDLTEEDYMQEDIVKEYYKWEGLCSGKCPVGQYSTSGDYPCSKCDKGSYNNQTGQTNCSECPIGSYQDKTGSTNCTSCGDTSITNGTGSIKQGDCLKPCTEGTYSDNGHEPCQLCSKGSYSDNTGLRNCTDCPVGEYKDKLGATSCISCGDATTTASTGSTTQEDCFSLTPCTKGRYSNNGYEPCQQCPRDTYTDQESAVKCTPCPAGKHTSGEGTTSGSDCKSNIAPGGTARQSGTTWGGNPEKAIDGDDSQSCRHVTCSHTRYQAQPWWSLELPQSYNISAVFISVPSDTVTGVEGALVTVGDADNSTDAECGVISFSKMWSGRQLVTCRRPLSGRYVRINGMMKERTYLSLSEVQVYSTMPQISCPVGTFSTTGFYPCTACPRGETSDTEGSTTCDICPEGVCYARSLKVCTNTHFQGDCKVINTTHIQLAPIDWQYIYSAQSFAGNWHLVSTYYDVNHTVREGDKQYDIISTGTDGYWDDIALTSDDYQCYLGTGTKYTGHRSLTKSGKPCQEWARDWPQTSKYTREKGSYCRNPDNSEAEPWCYVREIGQEKEVCGIQKCYKHTDNN